MSPGVSRRECCVVFALVALLAVCGLTTGSSAADALTTWTPGPDAVLDDTYDGHIDVPAMDATVPAGAFTVSGWFVDRSAQGWVGTDQVQVWQGAMGSGSGKLLAAASIGLDRPDVAAAEGNPVWETAGFGALVPADSLAGGPQTLSVYAHTPDKGWWYRQVNVTVVPNLSPAPVIPPIEVNSLPVVAVEKPLNGEVVLTTHDYVITGYALDKYAKVGQGVANSGVYAVEVYLGDRDNGGTLLGDASLGYSDAAAASQYGPQFASAGWRLTFTPTHFDNNTYLLYVYAHSAASGKEDVVNRFFAIRDTP